LALFYIFLFYNWPFLHVHNLEETTYYFCFAFLAHFSATVSSFTGIHMFENPRWLVRLDYLNINYITYV